MALSTQDKAQVLAGVPLFAGISAESMERLAAVTGEQEFAAGQFIVRQGQVGTGLYVVVEGSVKVVKGSDDVATLGPGDFFGELSVLDGHPRVAQVIADEPTVCLALASWDFEAVVKEQPTVALAILRGLAARLRGLTEAHRH